MRHLFLMVFSLITFLFTSIAWAGSFIVFGDSINDNGNFKSVIEAQGGVFPAETFEGRISNGFVALDITAQLAGETLAPSLFAFGQQAGGNYAFASARARAADERPIHLEQQVAAFLSANNGVANPDNTYVFFIGGNDVLDAFRLDDQDTRLYKRFGKSKSCGRRMNKHSGEYAIIKAAIKSIDSNVEKMIAAGATKIVVANAFDISDVPDVIAVDDESSRKKAALLGCKFNQKLAKKVSALQDKTGQHIVMFDFANTGKTILKNSKAFGFTNVTQGCLTRTDLVYSTNSYCDLATDIDNFLFFDGLHLSAAAHEYVGRALYAVLPR